MAFFEKIFNPDNETIEVTGLTSELKCLYIYNYFLKNNESIIFVISSLYEANLMYQSLLAYTNDVLFFPMDDFLTSEALATSPELKINRLETIRELNRNSKRIVVTNLMGFLRFLPQKEKFLECNLTIKVHAEYDIKQLINKLSMMGYNRETIVSKTGEMATRGFILDIFPIGESNPIRLEFFGDEIDEIRVFDPNTQIANKNINKIEIGPNTEFLVDGEIEEYNYRNLPFYTKVSSIGDFVSNKKIVFHNFNEIETSYIKLQEEIIDYNESLRLKENTKYMWDLENLRISNELYLNKFDNKISVNNTLIYNSYEIEPFSKDTKLISNRLIEYIKNNKTIVICLNNRYQINKIVENFDIDDLIITSESEIFNNKINLIIKNTMNGFNYNNYIVICEKEFFNRKEAKTNYKNSFKYGSRIRDINKLQIGDYIVHNQHGIGRYLGIKTLMKNNLKKDYLMVEYKGGDKLYIPVEKIELISKYSSNENIIPRINKLGGSEWSNTKIRIKKKIEDIANQLLNLYALRESSVGFAFDPDTEEQIEFESNFIYDDTIDQVKVTDEIKKDMEKLRPMDRLLCGDVGYGKTEVAFRAMFKAVLSGKQVAYLCPTTILSTQHYNNAMERFKEFPINIRCLNRFISNKEIEKTIEELKSGSVDIVIGTHRILSSDIEFRDLGLLVIDEEQRFGVKHKEKIKGLKTNVDVLTLSATPIPRTLQMSMLGIRNLSLLETPPINRYPIQTYVLEENSHIIKDSIYKELAREGQVFILYNKIEDMELKKKEIERLVPEANIVCAHGRMSKQELEKVMFGFINKENNILLCTTIIETGIDIPSVNTLIIIDADKFGLSQLYQIRGRVGRSNKIAYCYLMYKKGKILTDVANKRLNVIKEFTELGSGFSIAARDLSIRGAGDILGSEQAGFVDTVGIELYLKMLNDEVNKLKGINVLDEEILEQPLLEVETAIDDNYVEETELKIEIHRKINEIDSYLKLIEIKLELEDRFGNINENLLIYMYEEWFEKLAKKFNITRVKQTNNFIEITIPKNLTELINGELLFFELTKISRMFRFKMVLGYLVVTLDILKLDKHFIYYLIDFMEVLEKSIKK